jgi:hypothetical protein
MPRQSTKRHFFTCWSPRMVARWPNLLTGHVVRSGKPATQRVPNRRPRSSPIRARRTISPGGMRLGTSGTVHEGKTLLCRASELDCDVCPLKPQCCPKEPARKIPRDIHENARDLARSHRRLRAIAARAKEDRDAVRASEAHPEAWSASTSRPARRSGRVHPCRHRPEPAATRVAGRPATAICGSVHRVA